MLDADLGAASPTATWYVDADGNWSDEANWSAPLGSVIEAPGGNVYIAGDTGLWDGAFFREAAQRLGPNTPGDFAYYVLSLSWSPSYCAAEGQGADRAAQALVRHLLFDLGYHRVQLECYGFNERAIRHAERAGFVREGVKRKAYRRHGEWVDGVLFGLVREDLE